VVDGEGSEITTFLRLMVNRKLWPAKKHLGETLWVEHWRNGVRGGKGSEGGEWS